VDICSPTASWESGHKLFRDRIWGDLRFVFQADHRRYRATGFYDFPQRKIGMGLLNLAAPLVRLPLIRKRFVPRIKDSMILPFQGAVGTPPDAGSSTRVEA
jgi:hypothetical protein